VVEDSDPLRALISGAVRSLGFTVEAVADAKAAMRAFSSLDPDVLIADIDLGSRPNGVELAHILRAQASYIGGPVRRRSCTEWADVHNSRSCLAGVMAALPGWSDGNTAQTLQLRVLAMGNVGYRTPG